MLRRESDREGSGWRVIDGLGRLEQVIRIEYFADHGGTFGQQDGAGWRDEELSGELLRIALRAMRYESLEQGSCPTEEFLRFEDGGRRRGVQSIDLLGCAGWIGHDRKLSLHVSCECRGPGRCAISDDEDIDSPGFEFGYFLLEGGDMLAAELATKVTHEDEGECLLR